MASIRERTTKAGETTWAVLYRHGGRQSSQTFINAGKAGDFKALVEILGPDKALAEINGDGPQGVTVHELAAQFLAWKARDVEVRTIGGYRRDYANWIDPWFGHRAAESLDEADVQKWVDHMAAKLSPKTVAERHMLLHSMYDYGKAKSRRLVTHNPCKETDLPKRTKRPPKGTTVGEFGAILEIAARRNADAHDLILFLGETGWRWSEGAALPVRDVSDDGEHVWVTVTQVFRKDDRDRQILVADAAKSYAAFRRIRLFPASAAMVRRRIVGKGPSDLVFTNSRGSHWNQKTFLRETWPRILRDAGLGDRAPTPHWLRHMHVAVCAAAGASMPEIQRRIGHESIQTTINVYGGMIGDLGDDALAVAAAIMSGRKSAPGVAPVVEGYVIETVLAELESGGDRAALDPF